MSSEITVLLNALNFRIYAIYSQSILACFQSFSWRQDICCFVRIALIAFLNILACNVKNGWLWGAAAILTSHGGRVFPRSWIRRGWLIVVKLLHWILLFPIRTWDLICSILREQNFLAFLRAKIRSDILEPTLLPSVPYHHTFVTLLTWHQFGDHCTVLLVNSGLIVVNSTTTITDVVIRLVTMFTWLDLWQLNCIDTSNTSLLFIRADCALDSVRWKHWMVQMESALRCLTLSFVLVIVHAINIDNSLVTLAWMSLNCDSVVWSSIQGGLTTSV